MTDDTSPLLTAAEVAALFGVDPKTVARWAQAGEITSIRTPGGHRRFPQAQVRALLGAQEPAMLPAAGRRAAPPAALRVGAGRPFGVFGTPYAAGVSEPGRAAVIIGRARNGAAITITATSLEWLGELEEAAGDARARGRAEADMSTAALA